MDQSDEGADTSVLFNSSLDVLKRTSEVRSCKSKSKFRDALTEEPSNSMDSFVMLAVPSWKDSAPVR